MALVTLVFSCTGCKKYVASDSSKEQKSDIFINSDSVGEQKCQELLQYFSDKNIKGLKSMFCEEVKSSQDLDAQIQTAMKFFQGKIISHDSLVGINGGGQAIDHGKTTRLDISPYISNIVTNANKKYDISFYSRIIWTADKNKEGVSYIKLMSSDGQKCQIGKYIK